MYLFNVDNWYKSKQAYLISVPTKLFYLPSEKLKLPHYKDDEYQPGKDSQQNQQEHPIMSEISSF